MKSVSPELQAHLAEDVATLATCWRVARLDEVVLGFTTHDRDLVIGTIRYRAASGFLPTSIAATAGLEVDNLDVTGALSSASLNEDELAEGRFDHARIEIFVVNWADLTQGEMVLRTGYLGELTQADGRFTAEIRGLMESLRHAVGEVYSPECRADLGDGRCKVALLGFTHTGRVTAATDKLAFEDSTIGQADGWYDYGLVTWHSGANAGLRMEVRLHQGPTITLAQEMPAAIAVDDIFTMTAGCDKRLETCRGKFDNVVNFRGEPFVPGTDSLIDYPGLA